MMIRKVIGNKMAVAQDPRGDIGNIKQGIRNASRQCLSRGVTTIHDIMKSGATIRAYQEMARDGELPFRVDMLIRVIEASYGTDHLLDLGIVTGFGNDWLKIGGVKLSIDGGITGHAAAFQEPYADADDPCDCGLIRITPSATAPWTWPSTASARPSAPSRASIIAIGSSTWAIG
jgi:predicted amidohydrolase YtcJ